MPPKARRPCEDEVRRRWAGLDVERRQALLRFDDPVLVERIQASLQALFQKHMLMLNMGISLGSDDPIAASTLFTSAFELSLEICRSARNPHVVLVDPSRMPVLVMKSSYLLTQGDNLVDNMRAVLPDMLSEKSGRAPMSRARWKDLWATEPSSIQAMEQTLVKLVEQALWAMGSDPAYERISCEGREESSASAEVPLEPWMVGPQDLKAKAAESKKKKHGKKGPKAPSIARSTSAASEDFSECTPSRPASSTCGAEELDDDRLEHFDERLEDEADEDLEAVRFEAVGPAVSLDDLPAPFLGSEAASSGVDRGSYVDEGVGVGTFNLAGDAAVFGTELSLMPTASSTPAARARGRSSPLASSKSMHPPQLVCYIWNQTSQFAHGSEWPRHTGASPHAAAASTPLSVDPATPNHPSTPFSRRGQWLDPTQPGSPTYRGHSPVVSAVVKNTFVDISFDDPGVQAKAATSRASRSLSPLPSYGARDDDVWNHWHV